MKKLFLMLMLCAPMTLFAQKFGHLDSQALLQSLPEATAVQSKLEAKGKEYQKPLEDMQAELRNKAGRNREESTGYVYKDSADRSRQPKGFQ